MKTVWRWFARFCVAMLLVVATAFVLLWLLPVSGLCSSINSGSVSCSGGVAQGLGEFALTVLILSVFTGIPLMLAFIGVVVLIIRLVRRFQSR